MKFGLLTIYYNSRLELLRLMTSLPAKVVDKWIFIDGIFKYVKEKNPELPTLSDDGSTEIIKNSGFNTHVEEMPESTEFDKRNRYLELCQRYGIDYAIIVDTDEYFHYEKECKCHTRKREAWAKFKNQFYQMAVEHSGRKNVFNIMMNEPNGVTQPRPRCWYNPGQMRYLFNSHYHYANTELDAKLIERAQRENRVCIQQSAGIITAGTITLSNDPTSLRTKEQLERRRRYQQYLVKYEGLVQTMVTNPDTDKAHRMAAQYPDTDFKPL